ncbi:MAG: hypothetical protein V3U60_16720 [Gammaproteobacteria bacterium]
MEYDGHSRAQSLVAVEMRESNAATHDGNAIDTVDFESLEFIFFTGAGSGDFDMQLQESDTGAFGGEENIVVADDIIGTQTTSSAPNELTQVGYIGKKRYCRLTILATNSPFADLGAIAILSRPRSMPVADQ